MPLTKDQLRRLVCIASSLRRNSCLNAPGLVRLLREKYDIACSVKTVSRDLDTLRAEGARIEFDHTSNSYALRNKEWDFRYSFLSDEGLTALILGGYVAELILPSPLSESLRRGVDEHLAESVPEGLEDAIVESLVVSPGVRVNVPRETFARVFQAWSRHDSIRFVYDSPWKRDEGPRERCVEPHVLGLRAGVWYVMGHLEDTSDVRTFAVHRMRDVRTSRLGFEPDLKLIEHCRLHGLYESPSLQNVEVQCDADIAAFVKENGTDWSIEPVPGGDGIHRILIPAIQEEQLICWILNRRGKAHVVSHPEIRARIKDICHTMAEAHGAVITQGFRFCERVNR